MNSLVPNTAQVVFPIPVRKSFTYLLPDDVIECPGPGCRIVAPFGKKIMTGFIESPGRKTGILPDHRLKRILEILDRAPPIDARTFALARWIADNYMNPLGEVLQSFIALHYRMGEPPPRRKVVELGKAVPDEEYTELERRAPVQARCVRILERESSLLLSALTGKHGIGLSAVRSLARKGIVRIEDRAFSRIPRVKTDREKLPEPELTPQQRDVLQVLGKLVDSGRFSAFLLHGVTGSGKTRVYIEAARATLQKGRGVIILVPEISLTPQMYWQFEAFFPGRVVFFHSNLSKGERQDIWEGIRSGCFDVVIGPRSALFAPLRDPGLIVLDEEHDASYRQHTSPFYHARDVALKMGEMHGSLVVMGSATPSVETYYRSLQGNAGHHFLSTRIWNRPLPEVTVVDMRKEVAVGNRGPFSRMLVERIRSCLAGGFQCILLQNRRGFSSFMQCKACGHVFECPHCSVTLTFHKVGESLRCHYCGFECPSPSKCPACAGDDLIGIGTGTQRIEEEIDVVSHGARTLRMDRDSTQKHLSHFRILEKFRKGEADIMIGTQMIAKGLDFPRVKLVGVISADVGLYFPTFRGGERTFQLLTHVAGRSGRGMTPGEVVIQTYMPDHYSIQAARLHDYHLFFSREIRFREELYYPPFSQLLQLTFTSANEEVLKETTERFRERFMAVVGEGCGARNDDGSRDSRICVLGPAPAHIRRLKGKYRRLLLVKTSRLEPVVSAVYRLIEKETEWKGKGVNVMCEVDPMDSL